MHVFKKLPTERNMEGSCGVSLNRNKKKAGKSTDWGWGRGSLMSGQNTRLSSLPKWKNRFKLGWQFHYFHQGSAWETSSLRLLCRRAFRQVKIRPTNSVGKALFGKAVCSFKSSDAEQTYHIQNSLLHLVKIRLLILRVSKMCLELCGKA